MELCVPGCPKRRICCDNGVRKTENSIQRNKEAQEAYPGNLLYLGSYPGIDSLVRSLKRSIEQRTCASVPINEELLPANIIGEY